jgi:alpha-1,6-mannosyltransferase
MKSWALYIYFGLSVGAYSVLGYGIERQDFCAFITLFGILFLYYLLVIRELQNKNQLPSYSTVSVSILLRLIFLFALPNLSDDFYRFIWDGRLTVSGINPYLNLPTDFSENPLFSHLNSPQYYTVYPPVSQYIFAFSTWVFPENILGSVIVMRVFIILADIGCIILLKKFTKNFLWYAFNPLIIIELTGNLHFEGVMLCWFLIALYFLEQMRHRRKAITALTLNTDYKSATESFQIANLEEQDLTESLGERGQIILVALFFALAICTKLLVLVFMPLIIRYLYLKKSNFKDALKFTFYTIFFSFLLFLPFSEKQLFINFSKSLDLYFQKFEFNTSVYYLVRWLGFRLSGFNIIYLAGPLLSVFSGFLILWISFKKQRKILSELPMGLFVIILSIYFLFTTTVHPWYLTTLVGLACLTPYRFPMVWSGVVAFSYYAYTNSPVQENLWLVAFEYLMVACVAIYELKIRPLSNFSK